MDNKKLLDLVDALNAAGKVYFNCEEDGIVLVNEDKDGRTTDKYTIKRRPVATENGIEVWKYIARQSKSI